MASRIRLKSSHRRYLLKDDKRPAQKPRVEKLPDPDRERVPPPKHRKK